jgi:hypothetical protein
MNIHTAAHEADRFVQLAGGLPEITRAAEDLVAAIDMTQAQIDSAVFASRFPEVASDFFMVCTDGMTLTPMTRDRIEHEGEAGLKRAQLDAKLKTIGGELTRLIQEFVELRCDLVVSTTEF